ncbi:hypothetical protein ENBRE01_1152 [Enteropsectra breve]|nr:hypothetical protein ENBRE01_1152 [Enteropsectra breve]
MKKLSFLAYLISSRKEAAASLLLLLAIISLDAYLEELLIAKKSFYKTHFDKSQPLASGAHLVLTDICRSFVSFLFELASSMFLFTCRIRIFDFLYSAFLSNSICFTAKDQPSVLQQKFRVLSSALVKSLEQGIVVGLKSFIGLAWLLIKIYRREKTSTLAAFLSSCIILYFLVCALAIFHRIKRRDAINQAAIDRNKYIERSLESIVSIKTNNESQTVLAGLKGHLHSHSSREFAYHLQSEIFRFLQRAIFNIFLAFYLADKLFHMGYFPESSAAQIFLNIKSISVKCTGVRNFLFFFCEHWAEISFDILEKDISCYEKEEELNENNVNIERIEFKGVSFLRDGARNYITDFTQMPGIHINNENSSEIRSIILKTVPYKGHVLVNGTELTDMPVHSIYSQISYLSQRQEVLGDTVIEALEYGTNLGEEEIVKQVNLLGFSDFIRSLSEGYRTLVGDKEYGLSNGQRQLLCLLRALLKDAPLYILEEPYAFLDGKMKSKAVAGINGLKDKMVLVVSNE